MLSKYIDKNKFGGYTWQIKIDTLLHIYIHSTDNNSYVVEFKEAKWLGFKTKFSFVSNVSFNDTIIEAFERVYLFLQNHKEFEWTFQQKEFELARVLEMAKRSK